MSYPRLVVLVVCTLLSLPGLLLGLMWTGDAMGSQNSLAADAPVALGWVRNVLLVGTYLGAMGCYLVMGINWAERHRMSRRVPQICIGLLFAWVALLFETGHAIGLVIGVALTFPATLLTLLLCFYHLRWDALFE